MGSVAGWSRGRGGPGQARAVEEKGRRAGRAARQRRERKEEGEWEKEKEKEGRERGRALAGGIRGGRCDPVGHAQRCVCARMRPQEKIGVGNRTLGTERGISGKGLGF